MRNVILKGENTISKSSRIVKTKVQLHSDVDDEIEIVSWWLEIDDALKVIQY